MNFSWNPEQYGMQMGMQGMAMNQMMGQNDSSMGQSFGNINPAPEVQIPNNENSEKFIGPIVPEGFEIGPNATRDDGKRLNDRNSKSRSLVSRRDRNDRGNRDHRGRRRSKSREFDRNRRNDRGEKRERKTKWDTDSSNSGQDKMLMTTTPIMNMANGLMSNMPYSSGGMPDMGNIQQANMRPVTLPNMMMPTGQMMPQFGGMMPQEMQNVPNMPGMQNMMPGMMDQGMMMMNQQMIMMPNQQQQVIFFNGGTCLPPLPGTRLPNRSQKPPGCRTIFVGGLPVEIKESHLMEIFNRFGPIQDLNINRQGFCHIRFIDHQSVEMSFTVAGYRIKFHNMNDCDTLNMIIDYALNCEDQNEFENSKRLTPPRVEPLNPSTLAAITEKIKNEDKFTEAAPTLVSWLEHGECNKKNANSFYSLIQASNNHVRRLYNDKMLLDEELQTMKSTLKEKFSYIILQFEQVAKILTAAKHQRVSDHFTKQQRRNIEMWLRMTEDLENVKDEYNSNFDEDDGDKTVKKMFWEEKCEELKQKNEELIYELEGYKNEAHVAKDEAERKFEKFKAHFIAQQALQGHDNQGYPKIPNSLTTLLRNNETSSLQQSDQKSAVSQYEAKLISVLTAYLLVHPLGVTIQNIHEYVKTIIPNANTGALTNVLKKYTDIFKLKESGSNIPPNWTFIIFDVVKNNA